VGSLNLPDGVHVFERGWLSSNCIFIDDGQTAGWLTAATAPIQNKHLTWSHQNWAQGRLIF